MSGEIPLERMFGAANQGPDALLAVLPRAEYGANRPAVTPSGDQNSEPGCSEFQEGAAQHQTVEKRATPSSENSTSSTTQDGKVVTVPCLIHRMKDGKVKSLALPGCRYGVSLKVSVNT